MEFVGTLIKSHIVPATGFDLEQLAAVPAGKPGRVKFIFARSVQRNRWYRALVSIAAEGLGMHPGVLHAELKFKAGLVRRIITSKEFGTAVELESTQFATMEEGRFGRYVNLAIEILFSHYLIGVDRSAVFKQVEDVVGPRPKD